MVALFHPAAKPQYSPAANNRFVALLPQIRALATHAFHRLGAEAREDCLAEVVARSYCLWLRLKQRGRLDLAYPTPLARFAIREVRAGRRVGSRQNVNDLLSPYAQRIHQLIIRPLERREPDSEIWNSRLIEDRRAGPAETAAARPDLEAWFRSPPRQKRRIARVLEQGESTSEAAHRFGLTAGRISQLRDWLRSHWNQFQGSSSVGVSR
jgi:hypothetical protein